MTHTPHELSEAFPQDAATIHALKAQDAHFARMADEYHRLNRIIHRAETDIEPVADFTLEDMKKERLRLLDAIGSQIRSATAAG
ncbi:YdcH family protein [Limibaculum sp. FT325]|uniref:YdcH family protein n=1 Tax=Thermohalobaculum sediminis TaxID=2939436 RepID=UPI0020BD4ACE|nr:YdcH family protein [Limibaculum sediminis]MCL5778137.1 YdcH family protein [Limibaculum sediminis]